MYKNKKIFILGMARSGYEAAKFLSSKNCEILITDAKEKDTEKINELESLGIKVIITENQLELLDDSFDVIIKNPGVPIDVPVVLKAKELNIPVINEVELAYYYLPEDVKIIGITGSNGKTTTTTLTYEILKKAGFPVYLGGNIGIPACKLLDDIKENDYLVIEISSHQLYDFKDFKTDISILTNVVETHLEHFYTFDNYKNSKKKIFNGHTKDDLAIINNGNECSLESTKDILSTKITFSALVNADICLKDKAIYYYDEKIIDVDDIKIKGNHNYENIMCAISVAKHYGVANNVIIEVLKEFPGVEHRIEYVGEINKRKFYNDSKSTNLLATKIALSSFTDPTIILLGGLDRNQPLEELIPYMKHIKKIICYGQIKDRVKEFANQNNLDCDVTENLEEATNKAYESSSEEDIILLSPACASWDQFKDYEERGKKFKRIVQTLK